MSYIPGFTPAPGAPIQMGPKLYDFGAAIRWIQELGKNGGIPYGSIVSIYHHNDDPVIHITTNPVSIEVEVKE